MGVAGRWCHGVRVCRHCRAAYGSWRCRRRQKRRKYRCNHERRGTQMRGRGMTLAHRHGANYLVWRAIHHESIYQRVVTQHEDVASVAKDYDLSSVRISQICRGYGRQKHGKLYSIKELRTIEAGKGLRRQAKAIPGCLTCESPTGSFSVPFCSIACKTAYQ